MNSYLELKEMLCRELDDLVKKGELTAGSLDAVDKITHSIKSLVTIMAMDESGYSNEGGYSGRRSQVTGRYYDNGSSNEGSYARYNDGGSMDGGYSGRRYSRDEGKTYISKQLEQLMDQASGKEREVMQQALSRLQNM